jgi:7-cyano-7-deazaguanine synthase in queuosine biosynthesis
MTISVDFDGKKRRDDGLALITVEGPQVKRVEVDLPFRSLYRSLGSADPTALDLLVIASACYVVDKAWARKSASDAWTRDLSVSFPVSDPKRWEKVADRLNTALTFLSGDVWRTSFRQSPCKLFVAPKTRRKKASTPSEPDTFETVALFSGGLDSLIGTIDFLKENPTSRLMLIGHYDAPGPKSQQKDVYQQMSACFPGRTKLVQVRVAQRPAKNIESSLRSRSIVFLGLGIYAASEIGRTVPLLAPENGMIALNLPLTPSRSGSCSTRTMHPFYLNTFRSVLKDLELKNEFINPLALKTKGECVIQCGDLNLLTSLASRTVSCSHASRRQDWKRKGATNCGYCVPCLFRRASLHATKLDSGKQYGIDVCSDELTINSDRTSADDLRAVANGLRHFTTNATIRKAIMSVARVEPLDGYMNLVHRGLNELRSWIADKGSVSLRTAAGVLGDGHA